MLNDATESKIIKLKKISLFVIVISALYVLDDLYWTLFPRIPGHFGVGLADLIFHGLYLWFAVVIYRHLSDKKQD